MLSMIDAVFSIEEDRCQAGTAILPQRNRIINNWLAMPIFHVQLRSIENGRE